MTGASKLMGGLVLMSNLAFGQVEPFRNIEQWNAIDRLCEDLLHIERHTGRDSVLVERTRPLKNVVLKLYERHAASCCEDASVLAQVTTGRGGRFSFRDVKPGAYWLFTLVSGREYKLYLQLELSKDARTSCSDQRFEIYDSGDFQIGKTITVD